MTPAAIIRDVEEARRDVRDASVFVKNALACSDKLLQIDKDLLARSHSRIGSVPDRLDQNQDNALRKMRKRHLQQAERHVAVGQEHINRQREQVAQLEQDGHDTSNARKLLTLFEGLQIMHVAHRDRLARELGKAA